MGITIETDWTVLTCYIATCRAQWAIPDAVDERNRTDKNGFYCPNGHSQSYRGKTDGQKLAAKERELEHLQRRTNRISEQRDAAERRVSAQKGQVTRLKNRAAAGICPCCKRTFKELAEHMKSKHPDFSGDEIEAFRKPVSPTVVLSKDGEAKA